MSRLAIVVLLCARVAAAECFETPALCAFEQGRALLKSDPAAAALKFHASYKLAPSVATLAMYARSLEKAKDYARAVEAWERVIVDLERDLETARRGLSSVDEAQRLAAEEAIVRVRKELDTARLQLAQLGGHVGRVTLRFPAGTAQPVIITRKVEGENTVSSTTNLPVNAGGETLRITYPDARTQEIEIIVAAGNLEVYPVPNLESDDFEPATPRVRPVHVRRWVGLGMTGAGVIALGASAVFALQSRSARRDADCPGSICSSPADEAASHRADDRRFYAVASAVGGGVLLATGLVLWLTDRREPDDRRTVLRASAAPTRALCTLDFTF